MTMPAERELGEEPEPIQAKDVLGLTNTAASLLRNLDDFRRRV
jgi:hypothetical protein